MKKTFGWLAVVLLIVMAAAGFVSATPAPVTDEHINHINRLFGQSSITGGYVEFDRYGRLQLKGEYADERQVDAAFSIAQQVVGVKWVSPVTPENIKVKEWEKKIGGLFQRAGIVSPESIPGAPGPVRNRYALVVGVGQFKFGITPLQYTVRDATSFYHFLSDPNRAGFPRNNIYFLTDQNATRQNIARCLDAIRNAAGADDLVVIYMSSHGTPPDKFGGVHVVSYDTEVKPRERVWHTAVTETMLKEFVESLRAKRLVMVLDTCYSNGAYRGIPGFLPPGGKSLGVDTDDEGYGLSKAYGKRVFGAKDIVLEDEPKPKVAGRAKSMDNQDGYGKVLIGASSAGEKSWESDTLKNSVFTYYFVDGLQRHQGSVKDAFFYAKPLVDRRVKQEKGVEISQTPQAQATNQDWNMRFMKR
ncbi:MAG: Caspase domain protein [Syntrophorhabdaceae bacterium PtaU1.Bin034]|nr:MAG: Caspase domain protein [Syntrophorhabdaceae bacterium PtaU1.Bin034]